VRFTATPKDDEFGACHCSMCRRWITGPFLAVECAGPVAIEDPSKVSCYRSSEWAERGFCARCGTPLFCRLVGRDFHAVSLEAFDDRGGFRFASQIFVDEKPTYYDFDNVTKTMTGAEVLAAFAAPGGGDGK
jgi:hypothetical protein